MNMEGFIMSKMKKRILRIILIMVVAIIATTFCTKTNQSEIIGQKESNFNEEILTENEEIQEEEAKGE